MNTPDLLTGYDINNITVGVLGGHSALDVCHGAKKRGFRTVCVAQEGREKTYAKYFRTKDLGHGTREHSGEMGPAPRTQPLHARAVEAGCVDEVITVEKFEDVLKEDSQEQLRKLNTVFIPSRYVWVYFKDFAKFENDFHVPVFGNRSYVKLEERDQEFNQYDLLKSAGIRTPKIFGNPKDIDRPVMVKASEKARGYERAFYIVNSAYEWQAEGENLEKLGKVSAKWRDAPIEELILGAHVNFNFFSSPLSGELELMGTDTRRQTNLDGFLRLTASEQGDIDQNKLDQKVKRIENGHIAVTVKESLLEHAFDLGEKFVEATRKYDGTGIIGPFALQGAVVAEGGKEDIVIFDVSLRIPGSPGTRFTPYSGYLHGESLSYGERIAMEIGAAAEQDRLEEVVT